MAQVWNPKGGYFKAGGWEEEGTTPGLVSSSTRTNNALAGIIKEFESAAAESKAANLARKSQVEGLYNQMEQMYSPGGTFGQSYLSDLAAQKVRDVGSTLQTDISRGLFGLTNRGAEWESTVGVQARAKLEDLRTSSLSNVLSGKAGFLERIEDVGPDYSTIADLIMKASNLG